MSDDLEASKEHPQYRLINTITDPRANPRYILVVNDGSHTDVICDGMRQGVAQWMLGLLADRPPYPHM